MQLGKKRPQTDDYCRKHFPHYVYCKVYPSSGIRKIGASESGPLSRLGTWKQAKLEFVVHSEDVLRSAKKLCPEIDINCAATPFPAEFILHYILQDLRIPARGGHQFTDFFEPGERADELVAELKKHDCIEELLAEWLGVELKQCFCDDELVGRAYKGLAVKLAEQATKLASS